METSKPPMIVTTAKRRFSQSDPRNPVRGKRLLEVRGVFDALVSSGEGAGEMSSGGGKNWRKSI
jgi:hypothetical protein